MQKSNTTLFKINKILDELLIDARQSIQEIAKKCSTYRQKVWREIKKMEYNKIIWGYTAVVNEEKIGWKLFMVFMKMKPLTEEQVKLQIDRHRRDIPGKLAVRLIDAYYINGTYDWVIIFAASDWATAKKYYDNIRKEYEKYLMDKPEMTDVIFSTIRWGKVNPEIEKLYEFIPP
ncbi:MAG: Lrp/AsnC family transcriptional regulator [Thermoplasmata archaeon]|nr:Lrp/AsnC family transcriptional regulator [Thermoplasmata archaeon]